MRGLQGTCTVGITAAGLLEYKQVKHVLVHAAERPFPGSITGAQRTSRKAEMGAQTWEGPRTIQTVQRVHELPHFGELGDSSLLQKMFANDHVCP